MKLWKRKNKKIKNSMKPKKVYLVLSSYGGSVHGCFGKKKDAVKYVSDSNNYFVVKQKVESYESKKESVITPTGIKVNISKQLKDLLTHDLPLSMKYNCLSQISKDVNDRLKEIDNSIGKNTFGGGSYEYWSKQLNEHLKDKNLYTSKHFGMSEIEDKEPKVDCNTSCFVSPEDALKGCRFDNYNPSYRKYSINTCQHNNVSYHAIEHKTFCNDCKKRLNIVPEQFQYDWILTKEEFEDLGYVYEVPKGWIEIFNKPSFQESMLEAENELNKACKNSKCTHRNVTTSQYYSLETGKVFFTVKRCDNCKVDLLK